MRLAPLLLSLVLASCRPAADDAPLVAPPPRAAATPGPEAPLALPPPGLVVPAGMAFVPGGTVHVGAEDGRPDERPVVAAAVEPFLLDESPVTVERFGAFAEATGRATDAERFGSGGVLDMHGQGWRLEPGADWRHPEGPGGEPAVATHPVTQVSWTDAEAFCAWDGARDGAPGRLPTEAEWEHAARGARDRRARYAWGDALGEGRAAHANTWTGTFPVRNTAADGYRTTSPVGAFGATDLGLTDMGGNVWEWTADWYRPYADRGTPFTPIEASEKAQRGGSFLCHTSYCHGYRVSGRSHSTPETSLFNVGFRCARSVPTSS